MIPRNFEARREARRGPGNAQRFTASRDHRRLERLPRCRGSAAVVTIGVIRCDLLGRYALHWMGGGGKTMKPMSRITWDPQVMGGKPCLRGLRVTVGTIVGLVASGRSAAEILELYPYLEAEDIREALAYAAWRSQEIEVPLDRS